jgi:2-polyprenyl-3-methyl-5-hydroxy-6-metoxy-1,4-benzoquinol methylase
MIITKIKKVLESLRWRSKLSDSHSELPPVLFEETEFRSRERFRPNYVDLCKALTDLIEFRTVLDLGCANGFVLEFLMDRGKDVRGVELSSAVIDLIRSDLRERVTIASATTLGRVGQFDLVTCIEVAEHIPSEESAGLLNTIVLNARRWVYFTAASPYQPGHGHINPRPHQLSAPVLLDQRASQAGIPVGMGSH